MAENNEASPICRGKNLTWDTIMLFINNMPKKPMPKNEFNNYVEQRINSWTQTHSQIARQLAFYYEEDGICYPRFTEESSLSDIFNYVQNWAVNYFIPNPFAPSLKGYSPTCIYSYLRNKIASGESDYDFCLDSMFDVKLSSHDKVRCYLNNFTDLLIEDKTLSVNRSISLTAKVKNPTQPEATDPKAYYEFFTIEKGKKIVISTNLFEQKENIGKIVPFLSAIKTKPFLLLAGISGTGKSQIVRKLAQATDDIDTFTNEEDRWEVHKPANFELVQVKPNWHNSYDLVGYKSNINGEHYEYTPFIEFVAKAWQNPNTPFFLCLDEMNLAPVEEYFAEYLSAIESRSINASTGQYETDPIIKPFRNFGLKVASDMILHLTGEVYESDNIISELTLSPVAQRFLNKGLTLPKNLIVMGTVNMDDTTFSFSRKVLDRAMSIEMNEVDFEGCITEKEDLQMPVLTSMNSGLVNRAIKSLEVIEGSPKQNDELVVHLTQDEAETITDYLSTINNEILDGTPFKFGYRACNEALLYARACKELGCEDFLSTAIDEFTTMKILSRIEGDEQKLKTKAGDNLLAKMQELLSKKITLPESKSLDKIKLMSNILERDKFVSFWG